MTDNPKWDAFISHAAEDKDSFVRPLDVGLQSLGAGTRTTYRALEQQDDAILLDSSSSTTWTTRGAFRSPSHSCDPSDAVCQTVLETKVL